MRPAHDGGVVRGPHAYVRRADGSSGYEPAPVQEVIMAEPEKTNGQPSAADLDVVAKEETTKEATAPKKAAWGTAKTK